MGAAEKVIIRFKHGQMMAMANFGNLDQIRLPIQRDVPIKKAPFVKHEKVIFTFSFKGDYRNLIEPALGLPPGRYRMFEES